MNRSGRSRRGNMLALVGATTLVIVSIILFALWYMNVSMGSTAHRTAIESAALAAATDLGRIVVYTPQCGYVSLTGAAPIGYNNTAWGGGTVNTVDNNGGNVNAPDGSQNANDQFCRQVRSVNECLATARLDMIVAQGIGDQPMADLAALELTNIQAAETALNTELTNACASGGYGRDIYGNKVTPFEDAQNIYTSNQAVASTFVSGTFTMKLGELSGGIQTACIVPLNHDSSAADTSLNNTNTIGQNYRSQINIPAIGGQAVYFASVGTQPALSDVHKFTNAAANTNYPLCGAVLVGATQKFKDQGVTSKTSFSACANAGGLNRSQAPGAFTISFPDGAIQEFGCPGDILASKLLKNVHMVVKQAVGGDFPVECPAASLNPNPNASDWKLPNSITSGNNPAPNIYTVAFYDWLREGGSNVNVDSAEDMMTPGKAGYAFVQPAKVAGTVPNTNPALPAIKWATLDANQNPYTMGLIPTGIIHMYEFNSDGSIQYKTAPVEPDPYMIVPHLQFYAENNETIQSNTPTWAIYFASKVLGPTGLPQQVQINATPGWDMYVRSPVHHPGIGKHDGEPVDSTITHAPSANTLAWNNDYGSGGAGAGFFWFGGSGPPPMTSILGITFGGSFSRDGTGTGNPPMITDAEDFGLSVAAPNPLPAYAVYASEANTPQSNFVPPASYGSATPVTPPLVSAGTPRPTYTHNGIAVEVRFRRQINIGNLNSALGQIGYIGLMTNPVPGATEGTSIDPDTAVVTSTDTSTSTGSLGNGS